MKSPNAALMFAAALLCGIVCRSTAQPVNGIQAVVSDAIITRLEVENATAPFVNTVARQTAGRPQEFQSRIASLQAENMDRLVERQLILSDFKTSGFALPESYIEEAVQEEIRTEYGSRAKLTKTLQAQGMTYEKFRQQARDRIIISILRSKNVTQENIVSPYKIETYYKANLSSFAMEEQVKLRMITLSRGNDDASSRALAGEILAKLKEGAAFSEMASIHSQGSQRNSGGDLDWVETKGLRQELRDAVAPLKSGDLSGVVETPELLYIVLVEEKRPAQARPLNAVRDEIERILLDQQQQAATRRYIDKLKKKTFVRYF
jgi:peptidyl-prolyl cis-trans isomerase SurA